MHITRNLKNLWKLLDSILEKEEIGQRKLTIKIFNTSNWREIKTLTGKNVAVILADTEIIPFGTMDLAVGSSGIEPRSKMFGNVDNFGKPKFGGIDLVAHELTAACALVFGQVNAGIPAAIVRGYNFKFNDIENISNTLVPKVSNTDIGLVAKQIIRATAEARPLKQRLFLKIASWFI